MAIHTQESLSGFIASEPHLSFTEKGTLPQGRRWLVHADRDYLP